MLKRHPEWPLRVYVVWEAVLRADAGGPPPGTYARIPDHRVRQFWDRELLLSQKMVQDLLAGSEPLPEEMDITPETVIWDVAAVYGPSAAWAMPYRFPSITATRRGRGEGAGAAHVEARNAG